MAGDLAVTQTIEPPLEPFASASAVTAPPGASPLGSPAARWRPLGGLTNALVALLVVAGAVAVFGLVAVLNRLVVVADLEGTFVGFDQLDRVRAADDLLTAAAIASLVLMIPIAVVFIIWTWRAARNNEALGRDLPRLGSEWAIAGWLVPGANLVIPVLVVQDLWRGSNASIPRGDMRWRIAGRSALVGWWWGALLLAFLRGGTTPSTDAETKLSALRAGTGLSILGFVALVSSAVLAILVVRRLTARQEATLRAQHAAWVAHHAGAAE